MMDNRQFTYSSLRGLNKMQAESYSMFWRINCARWVLWEPSGLENRCVGLETQMIEVKNRGEWVITRDILKSKHSLNDRQIKVLDYLFEKEKLTIQEYEEICPGVTRRSLQRDLKDLLEKGLIEGEGATHHQKYRLKIEL